MTEILGEIKTQDDGQIAIIADNRLSDCAKLVALLIVNGITDKLEIAKMLGKSVRTIEPAYANARRNGYANTRNHVNDDTQYHVSEYAKSRNGTVHAIAHAPKELPNGNTSYEDTSMHACNARDQFEIEGLNGATSTLVNLVGCTLATKLGHPNFADARELLASQVGVYGPDKVRNGVTQWAAKVQDKAAACTTRALIGFIIKAQTGANINGEPDWKRQQREKLEAIDKIIEAMPS